MRIIMQHFDGKTIIVAKLLIYNEDTKLYL